MKSTSIRKVLLLALVTLAVATLAPATSHRATANAAEPLKALLVTGGGYHDYENQKKILTEGISARANVEWTIVLEAPQPGDFPVAFSKPDWAKPYDVIVHNQCYAKYSDDAGIERIVKEHLDRGVGAVMIHCAMHAFRDGKTKEWDKLVGVESRRHGPKFPIVVRNLGRTHPITRNLPSTWTTPQGELYHTSILPSATQLGVGFKAGQEATTLQTCIWANQYEKCRVFGTTLGHHNETMQQKVYLNLVANGLLWACGKLDDNGKPLRGYGAVAANATPAKFKIYLADGREVSFDNARQLAAAGLTLPAAACCGN